MCMYLTCTEVHLGIAIWSWRQKIHDNEAYTMSASIQFYLYQASKQPLIHCLSSETATGKDNKKNARLTIEQLT